MDKICLKLAPFNETVTAVLQTVARKCLSSHDHFFESFKRDSFPDNCVGWTDENGYVECMFDKINDIFQGFGSLVSLRLQKDGRAKSKQIWMNLSDWNNRQPKLSL